MTLMARDVADIVDDHIRYHLEAGVDFVIATDHRSVDETAEILRRYEREGHLRLLHETGEAYWQTDWVTRMARLAASEHGADWVVNSDVDEFWWPHRDTMREILQEVPSRYGAVRAIWRHFVLRPETPAPFFERLTVRRRPSLDVADPFCANAKVIHRGDPDVRIASGNHDAYGRDLRLLREWVPFELLHFPIRGREQMRRKYQTASRALADVRLVPSHLAAMESRLHADEEAAYRDLLVDDAALRRGLAEEELMIDTRLRDRLRGATRVADRASPSLADEAAFAAEVDAMLSLDSARRLAARVESFEGRLLTLEAARARLRRRRRAPV